MVVWGGQGKAGYLNTGGRYDPSTDSWTPTNTIGVLAARYYHTAVWSGTRMIVWGGLGYGGYLNTGGQYDPAADSWTPTSTTNTPDARYQHTAVWTGTRMVVWGGDYNVIGYSNTGGRYDPATDSWTATDTTNAPEARYYHTAVWTGTQMIVWGGYDGNTEQYLNTGGRYNPGTDSSTATSTANAPEARYLHTAVWTGNRMVVWGGLGNVSGNPNTGGRYNPSTDSWAATSTTNAPEARAYHTAVWSGTKMIVWGGSGNCINGYCDTGVRYDPATQRRTATSLTTAPLVRPDHTAVLARSQMIVWGGYGYIDCCSVDYLNTGGRYDPVTDSWIATSLINPPDARYLHTAVSTDSEMIVWGGYGNGAG